jgi:hypothetical protein
MAGLDPAIQRSVGNLLDPGQLDYRQPPVWMAGSVAGHEERGCDRNWSLILLESLKVTVVLGIT